MDSKLYEAVSSGDYNKFLSLINADPSLLRQMTVQKSTVLHVAASYNQKTIVEEITRRLPSIMYAANSKEDTALHLAARLGRLEAVKHLIGCAATRRQDRDLEADGQYKELMRMVNSKEDTALHDAVRNGHGQIAKLLVEKCPELAAKANKRGESPLFVAVENDYLDIAWEILKVESNCFLYGGRDGANVLHAFTIRRFKRYRKGLSKFQILTWIWIFLRSHLVFIEQAAFLEKKIVESPTHKDFVVELLNKFPDIIREADTYGWLPLHYAANLGSEEVAKLILQKEPSMAYEKDKDGMSALHIAAKEGHAGVFETIVKLCPDSCELLDVKDRTALHVAAANGKDNVVYMMLRMPSFMNMVNQEDMDGNTALHLAAINGNSYLVRMLAANERVAKNMINNQGHTTNDIVGLSPQIQFYEKLLDINLLERNGALEGMHQVLARKPISSDDLKNLNSEKQKLVAKEKVTELKTKAVAETTRQQNNKSDIWSKWSSAHLLVATIIATVTFSAAFQVPGGYDNNGMAVLRKNTNFRAYLMSSAFSFGLASSSIMVIFTEGFIGGNSFLRKIVTTMMFYSLLSMSTAFCAGISSVVEEDLSNYSGYLSSFSFSFPLLFTIIKVVGWMILERGRVRDLELW